jgi:hypothetical protein
MLYDDAKRRKQRQQKIYDNCLDKEYTFKPNLRSGSRNFENSESHKSVKSSLYEKLSQGNNISDRSQMIMANSQTLSNDLYDPETG